MVHGWWNPDSSADFEFWVCSFGCAVCGVRFALTVRRAQLRIKEMGVPAECLLQDEWQAILLNWSRAITLSIADVEQKHARNRRTADPNTSWGNFAAVHSNVEAADIRVARLRAFDCQCRRQCLDVQKSRVATRYFRLALSLRDRLATSKRANRWHRRPQPTRPPEINRDCATQARTKSDAWFLFL